jgi:cytochrome c oxidase assembly protein subunit 15
VTAAPTTGSATQLAVSVPERTRWLLQGNLVAQVLIVVTGGLVRLTSSGLGCPRWPECTNGSLVPVADQPQGFHKLVEFGNRTLTFALAAVAVASLVAVVMWVRRTRSRRWNLVVLAALVVTGVLGQAVLGGISVLTHLNPLAVGSHLLLSMAMIAAAWVLLQRCSEPAGPYRLTVRGELRAVAYALVGMAGAVLVLGTMVTGSGPHSGDPQALHRLPFDPRMISWLHADVVLLFIGLTVAFWLGARLTDAPPQVRERSRWLVAACVLQAVIGYTQYFTGLPWALVAGHVLGACLVWLATLAVLTSTRAPVAEG